MSKKTIQAIEKPSALHANANARKVISVLVLHGIIPTTNL